MKHLKLLSFSLVLGVFLTACSSNGETDASSNVEENSLEETSTEDNGGNEEKAESTEEEGTEEKTTKDQKETRYSETDESEQYVVTKSAEMNDVVEMGDLKLSFLGSTTGWFTANESDTNFIDGYEIGDNVYIIAFDVELENTSEESITYYFDVNAEIVTDSKEQIKSEIVYSDSIPGELHGSTVHNATLAFVTQTPPEDINEVRFMVPTYWGDDIANPISEGEEVTAYYQ